MSPLTPPEGDRAPGDPMTPNPKPGVNQSPGSAANRCQGEGECKGDAAPQLPVPQSPAGPVEPPAVPNARPGQRPFKREKLRAMLPTVSPLTLPQPDAAERLKGCVLAEMIRVRGTVQGVGFRPTAYRLARDCGLKGQIWNDGRGVSIRVAGSAIALQTFVRRLRQEAPPLAHIEAIERSPLSLDACEWSDFAIVASRQSKPKTHIAVDSATCDRCREDLFDPASRYYRYPFVNCTHCGPRLSVIQGLPYDRARTTMAVFPLCGGCKAAYHSPSDRRFHAQPVACRVCGPKIWLERAGEAQAIAVGDNPESVTALLDRVRTALAAGAIVAIKGLGGFHLVCDGTHGAAVDTLRRRKGRPDKPLALMGRSLEVVQNYCQMTAAERTLLRSPRSPIVLLERRDRLDPSVRPVAEAVAPHQDRLGFMVPYTPLHHLLFETLDHPLVFTSGNASGKPQCIDNGEARQDLGAIADWFILHDRDITHPLDDSVVRFWPPAATPHAPDPDPGSAPDPEPNPASGSALEPDVPEADQRPGQTQAPESPQAQPLILRRGRGYAPEPLILPPGFEAAPPVLALGGQLKAAFGFVRQGRLILSQYLGNLSNAEAFAAYWRTLDRYLGVFDLQPTAIAFDCHPDYRTTTLGRDLAVATGRPTYAIQHHHAHGAACLADNGVPLDAPPSLAIAFDGLGYGTDGTLWGGEFLWLDYRQSRRLACLRPFPALGGDRAAQQPWRNAYVQLHQAKLLDRFLALGDRVPLVAHLRQQRLETLERVVTTGLGSPLTSSMGRLFDAIAAAAGLAIESCSYEGQAAQTLEGEAVRQEQLWQRQGIDRAAYPKPYPFGMRAGRTATADPLLHLDPAPLWAALIADLEVGVSAGTIAWRFHQGLAVAIAAIAAHLQMTSPTTPFSQVLLTGGTFQNAVLTVAVARRLRSLGLTVLTHRQVPANDGGLALGQAAIAAAHLL